MMKMIKKRRSKKRKKLNQKISRIINANKKKNL
jgi:hypothetical protein